MDFSTIPSTPEGLQTYTQQVELQKINLELQKLTLDLKLQQLELHKKTLALFEEVIQKYVEKVFPSKEDLPQKLAFMQAVYLPAVASNNPFEYLREYLERQRNLPN